MMKLEEALSIAIANEGISILKESRIINYLSDLNAFDSPSIKKIMSSLINDGYINMLNPEQLSDITTYDTIVSDVTYRLITLEGFQNNLVKYVIECLLFALKKTQCEPLITNFEENLDSTLDIKDSKNIEIRFNEVNGSYIVTLKNKIYELNESQYKAILRKKEMPADRLCIWLKAYTEQNIN